MDDTCAVCADTLEWVAFGACAHKEVCSTCVARLRFICDDRRCCICKTDSPLVFVTKALGDYTKTIRDFSILPSEPKEGRVGQYWYHEDTQAFFDDLDHYKMIKAMCKLSCSVCDKMETLPDDTSRKKTKFRNIEQLKGHLFHKHRLLMCSLCLEGRKVFICEQKLYTRSQLTQHTNSGDSEVDGTESERGGFMGHPNCEFCRTPFYGDNELYMHMSTEHYTCHICQRQHPGQYEYYKNYDDLEIHFRRDHLLCEDEDCLAKKFIVFQSEGELKRHNALEHGGRMSRSKRNAALQIPTSFRYRRSSEQGTRRGRAHTFLRDPVDSELSLAIQASLDTAGAAQSTSHSVTEYKDVIDGESLIPPLDSLATTDSEPPSRYLQALSISSRNGTLGESSFPPLAAASGSNQSNSYNDAPPKETMAAHLQRKNNRKTKFTSSAAAWSAGSHAPAHPVISPDYWPSVNAIPGSKSTSGQSRLATETGPASSSNRASAQGRPPMFGNSSFAGSLVSSRTSGRIRRISHSSSAPNLSIRESHESSSADFPPVSASQALNLLNSDFPPVSAVQMHKSQNSDFPTVSAVQTHKSPTDLGPGNTADVHLANKSLVEKMRAALGFEEDKFNAFKEISGEYRQGSMDAMTYMAYVDQFGLSHLVLEMARLLPNAQKQKELVEAYNAYAKHTTSRENGGSNDIKDGNTSKKGRGKNKGKGKAVDTESYTIKDKVADNVISTVRELQSSYRASGDDVEVLSKDGYRTAKSKHVDNDSLSKLNEPGESVKQKSHNESLFMGDADNKQSSASVEGKSKQRKKTSKFHRVRLGDGSVEAIFDGKKTDPDPDPGPDHERGTTSDGSFPARGVWGNGGGQKLLAITSRGPKK